MQQKRISITADHLKRVRILAAHADLPVSKLFTLVLERGLQISERPFWNEKDLFRHVDELVLSVRSQACLQQTNIQFIGELVQCTEQDLLKARNFGRRSLMEIKEVLADMGLSLGMKVDDWPQMLDNYLKQLERRWENAGSPVEAS